MLAAKVNRLMKHRRVARARKDLVDADRIRDELKAKGIEFQDEKDGTTIWLNRPSTLPLLRDYIAIAIAIVIALALSYYLW